MTESGFYHDGHRQLQAQFGSERLADRLADLSRSAFTDDDKAYIEGVIYFFLATVDSEGRPDCSFKGGPPGFVRVTGPSELAFPDYDGNGMFRSLGNMAVNAHVALLFINLHGAAKRLRVNGRATISRDDPLLAQTVGAQMMVRVQAEVIFPNCPRYIPAMDVRQPSIYTPQAGAEPEEPVWKDFDVFRDLVPPRQPTFKG